MSRPLRLEFAGALHHITSRGNSRNLIYLQDDDFELFLQVLADVCERYNWDVHAYCLMSNHYHLLVETPDANLSQGMRQLNASRSGGYTQKQIGDYFGLHYSQISRIVAKYKI
jgi:putative transposase